MEMELTPEQGSIVSHRGSDLLVTAGAGSGKTHVLVERYLSLLSECRIPEIAAVTFTDAAATEMRERVRREVQDRPDFTDHRRDLDEAVIGTFHSICLRILREHPVEAALDPAARVLGEDEAELELMEACIGALEEAAEADDQRSKALLEIGVYAVTNALPQMVRNRDEVEKAYGALTAAGADGRAELVKSMMEEALQPAVEEVRPELAELASWLRGAHIGESDGLHGSWSDAMAALGDPKSGDWRDLLDRSLEVGGRIKLNGGSARNWSYDLYEVKAGLRRIRDISSELEKLPLWNEHDELALEVLDSLYGLFRAACAKYEDRKRGLAALDYLDLEIRAIELLRSKQDIAAAYRTRFRHVMVDELQDVNPPQIELLRLLVGDDPDAPARPDLFLVGDVKQAIYRFRGSDVRHFAALRRETDARGTVHALSRSFRAHNPLVSTLNALFEVVFHNPKRDFEAAMQSMEGRGTGSPSSPHVVIQTVSDAAPNGEKANAPEKRRVEANAVAAEVKSLLENGALVWARDPDDVERTRPARPSDVAILLRRLSNVHLFEQALQAHGVPYRTASGTGYFARQEVLDLTNLLGWLAEPDDAIALVGALRSPLFMIDDESLLALASNPGGIANSLRNPPDGVREATLPLCKRAAEVLDDLRARVPFASPDALLERALDLTAYEAAWAPMRDGDQVLANIRKFVDIARTLEGRSLDEFVSYVRQRRDDLSAREGQAVLDESDVVRLMTIHSAKGLQFPIVFVPEAHLPPREAYTTVRWRADEGISVTMAREIEGGDSRRRPGFYDYLLNRDLDEETAEHKRLFYVAATRAADALYISGDDSAGDEGWVSYALSALGSDPPEGVEVREALPADLEAIARRPHAPLLEPPAESREEVFVPPLVARPPVIPLRSSTPVTSLQTPGRSRTIAGHGDGLGLVRGSLAHRAIQAWFTTGARPDLAGLAGKLQDGLDQRAMGRVISEVDSMLDLLDGSPLADTLRESDTLAYFEMPFTWDWDGAAVHGSIDLVYRNSGAWHIVDFKTDDLRGRPLEEVAAPYMAQLGIYASALEQAIGERPAASLLFLRTGDVYSPTYAELDDVLTATRARIDQGHVMENVPSSESQDSLEFYSDLL